MKNQRDVDGLGGGQYSEGDFAVEILKRELEHKKEEIGVLGNQESGEPNDLRILQDKLVPVNMEGDKLNKAAKRRGCVRPMTEYPEVEPVQSKLWGGCCLKKVKNEVRSRFDLGKRSLQRWSYITSLSGEMRPVCNRRSPTTCLRLAATSLKSGMRSIAQTS